MNSIVALVTPFTNDNRVDCDALINLVEWHIEQGTDCILVGGTTGESPTLSDEELTTLIETTVKTVNKRIPVMVGTGTNCTQKSIDKTKQAKNLGADYALLVTPYYNKPTQQGLIQHFTAIANSVDIPQILYDNPSRTALAIATETTIELSQHQNIIGIKDASGELANVAKILQNCPADFKLWTGNDPNTFDFIKAGGHGTISVTANVAPKLIKQLCQATLSKDYIAGQEYSSKLAPLIDLLFVETNPIPVKWALHILDKIGPNIRLPLTPLSKVHHKALQEALNTLSL